MYTQRLHVDTLNKLFRKILIHTGGWVIFLLLPIVFSMGRAIRFDKILTNVHDQKILVSWILLIGFSYLNHLWMVPRFYLEKRYGQYIALLLLCLVGTFLIPEMLDLFKTAPKGLLSQPPPPKPPFGLENSHFVLFFLVIVLVSISYHTQIRLRATEQQRLETELENLKSQIQPHFLFNTLNSIYALALRKDEKTADTVVKLSEFLRYVIRDTQNNEVALEKEITYLSNYIDLQKSRLRNTVDIDFGVTGEVSGQKIAPLILFIFIENAFQHGVNPDEESNITIRLKISEETVKLFVSNRNVNKSLASGSGIGIENARKRLNLLYPDRHELRIIEIEEDYTVELSINP